LDSKTGEINIHQIQIEWCLNPSSPNSDTAAEHQEVIELLIPTMDLCGIKSSNQSTKSSTSNFLWIQPEKALNQGGSWQGLGFPPDLKERGEREEEKFMLAFSLVKKGQV
jgi:hypothetical protein